MDQAEQLRVLMNDGSTAMDESYPHRVIAVASGKGGVGKSNFCINFALGLQEQDHSPVVLDADIGFANVDVLLGERPKHTLSDVLEGLSIWQIVQTSHVGLPYLSAGRGFVDIHDLSSSQMDQLLRELVRLQERFDTVIVDGGAGHGTNAGRVLSSADELILLTTPEPTAIADAYALVKLLKSKGELPPTKIVVNRAPSILDGKVAGDKLRMVAKRFLGVDLSVLGYVLEDDAVADAVMKQRALMTLHPDSKSARCVGQLVRNYLQIEARSSGRISGFFERLFRRRMETRVDYQSIV
jgi:flagellar biosynthesis protein FlhG